MCASLSVYVCLHVSLDSEGVRYSQARQSGYLMSYVIIVTLIATTISTTIASHRRLTVVLCIGYYERLYGSIIFLVILIATTKL